MSFFLVGVQGQFAGNRFPVSDRPLTLGRDPSNEVVLSDPAASRQHAEILFDGSGYVIHDRGSGNGTYVNGERVTVHPLQAGDQFAIGEEVFRFETADSPTLLVGTPSASGDGAGSP